MNIIEYNINNLTSLWKTVSQPFNSYFTENGFNYSLIKDSEWPNRLWLNEDIDQDKIVLIKEKLASISTSLIIPYWDIYKSNSFKILEENNFKLKFEQIAMSLKINHSFCKLNDFKLIKVSTQKSAKLWSIIFKKSFGYLINPKLITKTYKHINYYIAFHKSEAIGTGILHTTNRISGIHSVGIVPKQRRKGYAEEIMKILINKSIKKNTDYITLQASEMGVGLYLKLGFKEDFRIKNYTLQQNI